MCLKPTIQRSATDVVLGLVNQAVFQASGFSQGLIDKGYLKNILRRGVRKKGFLLPLSVISFVLWRQLLGVWILDLRGERPISARR